MVNNIDKQNKDPLSHLLSIFPNAPIETTEIVCRQCLPYKRVCSFIDSNDKLFFLEFKVKLQNSKLNG